MIPINKGGATARFSYKASDSVTVEFGGSLFGNALRFDNPGAVDPQRRVQQLQPEQTWLGDGFARVIVDPQGAR